jgi:hypothetical protein
MINPQTIDPLVLPPLPLKERSHVFSHKACVYCGSRECLLMDHFIPKSITKADRFLVPAYHRCNFSKRNQHPKRWYFCLRSISGLIEIEWEEDDVEGVQV